MNIDDNATLNNVSAETKVVIYHRRTVLKPLITYTRNKRKGSLGTCLGERRKVPDFSVMNPLSIQDSVQNGDQLNEVPSVCSSKNMCQVEVTAGDGASLIAAEDMTLEKAINGYHDCKSAAAKSVKVNEDKLSSDSVIDNKAENVEMAENAQQNDVRDKVFDVLVAEENLSKSTCSQENKTTCDSNAEVVQKRHDTMGISSPSSSQTNVLDAVTTQFRDEDLKLPLIRAPAGSSRRKLLVLDVNGLLADIVPSAYVSDRYTPDTTIAGKAVFKRPFCDEFLEFCFRRFNVGVWSSRLKRNVNSAVEFLMGKVRNNLLFCWDQSHCTATGFNTVENSSKPLVLKELKKLWERSEHDLPWERGEYNASNTLLLDDSPYKALGNPPNTAIFPHTYQYRDDKDNLLGPGGGLYVYLEGLAEAADVQMYVKQNPFGQQPITEENSSWDFYLKVMESSTSIPSQSPKSSTKAENVVSQADLTSSAVGKLEESVDNKCTNQECTMVGSSREVLEVANSVRDVEADYTSGSLEKEDLKNASGTLEVDNSGKLVKENTEVCGSGESPSENWRCRKRGRSPSGSRSPSRSRYPPDRRSPWGGRERHVISHRFSHERYRSRSRSPSFRRGREFGGDRMGRYNTPLEECRDFMRGKCYRGASCWYLHHESDMTYGCKQRYQNVPPSSSSYDNNEKVEISPPERSGHDYRGVRRNETSREECRDFNRGKCHRGASCRHLHNEYSKIDGSRYSWSKQQYPDVPTISKSCDVYWGPNSIPPARSATEHNECNPQDLKQEITVISNSGMKEELKESLPQFSVTMRTNKPWRPECHHFMRGSCSFGARCWYSHHESDKTDRSRAYRSKEQYENVPFNSKGSDNYGEIESIHGEETQDLKQQIPIMEDKEGIKEEVGKSSTQPCDGGSNPEPCALPIADAEEKKVPDDVAHCLPAAPVEISASEPTQVNDADQIG